MQKTIDMPEILTCVVKACVYNRDLTCRAKAITVGHKDGHLCDTMIAGTEHTAREETAGVGACRSTQCLHNEDYECQAEGIRVGISLGHVECLTFLEK
jgi:hypothetical protein